MSATLAVNSPVGTANNNYYRTSSPYAGQVDATSVKVRRAPGNLNTDTVTISAQARTAAQAGTHTARPDAVAVTGTNLSDKAARNDAAKNYNAILGGLRAQYGEAEAMRRFDEIMRADGFERVETAGGDSLTGPKYFGGNLSLDRLSGNLRTVNSVLEGHPIRPSTPWDGSNMVYQSNFHGAVVDGESAFGAESWAIFDAKRPFSEAFQNAWQSRNLPELSEQAGFDVAAYMSDLPDARQNSAVAVNADMGALVSSLLDKAGITLESGAKLSLVLCYAPGSSGPTSVGVAGGGEKVQKALGGSRELLLAMKAQLASPPPEDAAALAGQYEDGDRSIEYEPSRKFSYSADNEAVVVYDFLGVRAQGYTYAKKVSDAFDPAAEVQNVMTAARVLDTMHDEDYPSQYGKMSTEAAAMLNAAHASGEPAPATIAPDELARYQEERYPYLMNNRPGADEMFYAMTEEEAEEYRKQQRAGVEAARTAANAEAAERQAAIQAAKSGKQTATETSSRDPVADIVRRLFNRQAALQRSFNQLRGLGSM